MHEGEKVSYNDKTEKQSLKHSFPKISTNKNSYDVTASAFGDSKTVNIVTLNANVQTGSRTDVTDMALLPARIKYLAKIKQKLESIPKIGKFIDLDIKATRQYTYKNEDDKNSRFYRNVKEEAFNLTGSAGGTFMIPGLSFNIKVFKVGCYISPSISLGFQLTDMYAKKNTEENYTFESSKISGNLEGALELGAKASLMEEVKDVFDLELKAYGKCSMGVEKDSKGYKCYVNPLVGGVSGTVKMPAANWDIADFKYEFNITDRYEW